MVERGHPPSIVRILLAFAAIYIVWGSTYLAIRYAVETLPPFLMAGARFFTAGLIMYVWSRGRGDAAPSGANWKAAFVVGGLLLLGGNGLVSWAEMRIESGLAALLVATAPLWMVLLQWGLGGARPVGRVWLGLLIGFAGLAILVGPSELLGGRAADPYGAGAVVLASLSWALGTVISGRVALAESPYMATATEMIGGGALLLLVGTLRGEWSGLDLAGASSASWIAFVYLILVGSLIGFASYVWLLRHVEVAKVSTYAYVNPVVAVFLGWLIAGEVITTRILIAAAVIVAAVVSIVSARSLPASGGLPPSTRGRCRRSFPGSRRSAPSST